ncbi:MAG: Nif3-like dinuclear metal center hexameric protein [Erysipelotrichaceae bacterium]|nr:Nif3-like dinuclear metal center hexameric protein [Erysipelotrichaceae bacterium]
MKISEIIDHLESLGSWVDFDHTRDLLYCGQTDMDVDKVAVCWVATRKLLQKAAEEGIHFIISHENFLYVESTNPYKGIRESRKWKLDFCRDHAITVYRCHDVWDRFEKYGILDTIASLSNLPFNSRDVRSFYRFADVRMSAKKAAEELLKGLSGHGVDSLQILGDPERMVSRIGIGTGAITDFSVMHKNGCDCVILSDDGSNNWIDYQWCLDNDIPVIIIHHSTAEIPGMKAMAEYLGKTFPSVRFVHLDEGFSFTTVSLNK